MKGNIKTQTIHVRGIEVIPWREARAQALRQGKTLGQWLSEAIKEKLARNGKRKKP